MGDVSDMILEGILCQGCGVLMDDLVPEGGGKELKPGPGYPRSCEDCE